MRKSNYTFYDLLKLYKLRAAARGFSPKTVRATESNLRMISQFFNLETKVRKFREEDYKKFLIALRKSDYSRETMYDLNATLRKLINLARKQKLVKFDFSETGNIRLNNSEEYKLISGEDFRKIREYFNERGEREFEFLFLLLYYTGIRIGEALALRREDFKIYPRERDGRILVNKSYLYEFKLIKEPKNKKNRVVPIPRAVAKLFQETFEKTPVGERIFQFSPNAANLALKRAAKVKGVPEFHCHSFRHTYISNLARKRVPLPVISSVSGDTQKTVLSRYSHMFFEDEKLVLKALSAAEYAAKPEGYAKTK